MQLLVDFGHIVFYHAFTRFLAGKAADAVSELPAAQRNFFNVMTGVLCALYKLIGKKLRVADFPQTCCDNQNFAHYDSSLFYLIVIFLLSLQAEQKAALLPSKAAFL